MKFLKKWTPKMYNCEHISRNKVIPFIGCLYKLGPMFRPSLCQLMVLDGYAFSSKILREVDRGFPFLNFRWICLTSIFRVCKTALHRFIKRITLWSILVNNLNFQRQSGFLYTLFNVCCDRKPEVGGLYLQKTRAGRFLL